MWRLDSGHLRLLRSLVIFEFAFFIAYAGATAMSQRTGSPFWLPDSVLLCALLLSRPRNWWIYLVAPLPLRLLVVLPPDTPTWFVWAASANDSLKALLAAAVLRRVLCGRAVRFDSLHDFWIYLAATAALTPALSGFAGAAAWVARGREFWPTWRDWFLGDALTNIVLTPLLLCLILGWRKFISAKPVRVLEGLVVFSALAFAVVLAYSRGLNDSRLLGPYEYFPVALLLLAAVRFGPSGASGALAIMSMVSVVAASIRQPSVSVPAAMDSVLSTQLFLIVIAIPILSLSVLLEQQRKTEQTLRESEGRFRNMADTAAAMIWISGPDKTATFFNRGWLNFTGRRVEQELGYGWASGLHPDHRADCLSGYSSSFDEFRLWHAEYLLQRADGEYRWILCSGAPRFANDRVFAGYIVSCFDITDLKRALETSLAGQKLESLGLLAGGIAHDFNNLLGDIHAEAELAESNRADGSFPGEEIQTIKTISMRASEIVRQLMIYAGHERSDFEPLDLSRLVAEMLALIKITISKSAVLKTDLAKDLPAVLGNGPQIRQVVMNLVLNASDALGEKGGVITVSTSTDLPKGNYARLVVSDTGPGISREAQARIFDPFFTTKFAGRGLGLAVVQGIVRAHNGLIDLASVPGEGTTFQVLWPFAGPSSEVALSPTGAARSIENARSVGTILVVEDEDVLRVAVSKMLRKEGFTVIEAGDGSAAVTLFREHRMAIDLVLLDMTVPGTASQVVVMEAARIRPDVKVLLTSAYSREMAGTTAGASQVRGFIRKPFRVSDLVTLIRETLSS
jgi:PAS domain S-box-containing protein